ncbi:heme ABC exporter ATP-binding protein CcmA [Miniphocaeibacter halophilus]|uniref:Heme ABC exporter ATP-binding protein CcmA n=1 Tax=Miniphocaeibacter halophilus TaxID=2931922 RepID=A0AC61MSU4_9FIRM|nr:heme ABC exporter ATP-binding protein CcmA [Miniphocaeibacter halophilus]QQK08616.1 heme ABC exporter ATP-binding protein CcmA [Miniphocaeibacter halophilus]
MYLTVKNLTLYFGNKKILDSIDFHVQKGEIVTLLGPSGCGKSTLLRTIAGLEKQEKGKILLDGEEIDSIPTKYRNIGFVFQQYALFPNMTVFENIAFGLRVKKLSEKEIGDKVDNILEIVQLKEFSNRNIQTLSGGQQQRVALARSLVTEPKILLLDEPLSALDAKIRKQLQTDLRRIQKKLNITMIFVTHDQEEAMAISDRIFVLNKGKIIQSSTPNELYAYPKSNFIAEFIGSFNRFNSSELEINNSNSLKEEYIYYVRPEMIELEKSENSIEINVELEKVIILGAIKRYIFKSEKGKSLIVDKINNYSNKEEKIDKIYISKDSIISIPKEKRLVS